MNHVRLALRSLAAFAASAGIVAEIFLTRAKPSPAHAPPHPRLAAKAAENIPAQIQRLPTGHRDRAVQARFTQWGELDPAAALQCAESEFDHAAAVELMTPIVTSWIRREPFAAWDWILSAPSGELFALPALRALAREKPVDALAFALNWKALDSDEVFFALDSIIDAPIAAGNFRQAAALAELAPNSDLRLQLILHLAAAWGAAQPAEALRWVCRLPTEREQSRAAYELMQAWASREPAAAAAFAAALPPGALRSEATTAVITAWNRRDPVAAGDWLAHLGPPSDRAPAIAVNTKNPGQ